MSKKTVKLSPDLPLTFLHCSSTTILESSEHLDFTSSSLPSNPPLLPVYLWCAVAAETSGWADKMGRGYDREGWQNCTGWSFFLLYICFLLITLYHWSFISSHIITIFYHQDSMLPTLLLLFFTFYPLLFTLS